MNMAVEANLLLNDLNSICDLTYKYDLSKNKNDIIEVSKLINEFTSRILSEELLRRFIEAAQEEYNNKFEDYVKLEKSLGYKIDRIGKDIISFLHKETPSNINIKNLKFLNENAKENVGLIVLKCSETRDILNKLSVNYPNFVDKFRSKNGDYNFIEKYNKLIEELEYVNRISSSCIWSDFCKLFRFMYIYDCKKYNEIAKELKKNKKKLDLAIFDLRKKALDRSLGDAENNAENFEYEINFLKIAMRKTCSFFERCLVLDIVAEDNKKNIWSYKNGRFIGNGEFVDFEKDKCRDQILEITTQSKAGLEKVWTYEEFVKIIHDSKNLNINEKTINEACVDINTRIYNGTGMTEFYIIGKRAGNFWVNPNYYIP